MRHDPLTTARRRAVHAGLAAAIALTAAACTPGSDEQAAGEQAAGGAAGDTAATAAAATADTGMAGMAHGDMDHSAMANMNRSAARDSNQLFLRMMSDHHQGLIAMADSAEERVQGASAKADARKLHRKQADEQTRMLGMLRRQYTDSVTPTIMPSNRAMLDSTLRADGPELDRTFYRQVVNHHREGVTMGEKMAPHLTGEVKQMAAKMMADQRREIQEFERKAGDAGGS
jgi:uncharacterized protein (DUF305 family)